MTDLPHGKFRGLYSRQPAVRWQDAFPSGNGTVGAMPFGGIASELILLNHERVWRRHPKPPLPDVSHYLTELRALLAEGKYTEADLFLHHKLVEGGYAGIRIDQYQPAFDLLLEHRVVAPFADYSRTLDFETGVAVTSWREGGHRFRREVFVSRADDLVLLRLSVEGGTTLAGNIALVPHHGWPQQNCGAGTAGVPAEIVAEFSAWSGGNHVGITGRYPCGTAHGGVAAFRAEGGRTAVRDGRFVFENASRVSIALRVFADEPEAVNWEARSRGLEAPDDATWENLLGRHARSHQEIFCRAGFSLVPDTTEPRTNEVLLQDVHEEMSSVELLQRLGDFGRYLLISSSRPGGLPANLQGIWNGDHTPAWSSDFHNDTNIQMNYWQALPGGMPEIARPYFDFYISMLEDYAENAEKIFGCRGILAPVCQGLDGKLYPEVWANWTAGAGWLGQMFYDYWLHTGDDDFLRERAVPFLARVADFYEDFLIAGEDGKWIFSPSLSPENHPEGISALCCTNATMDVAVAREVLTHLCEAGRHLELPDATTARWHKLLSGLPAYQMDADGCLREWLTVGLRENHHHRHLSHLYPAFPGWEILPETHPGLANAVRIAAERRLSVGLQDQTGWSLAFFANLFARLGEGNRALELLEVLSRSCVGPNLFTYHNDWRAQGLCWFWGYGAPPPFQIDANLGITAAIQEMLLFSTPHVVRLLPALPSAWKAGHFHGMQTRAGIAVDCRWDMDAGSVEVDLHPRGHVTVDFKFPFTPACIRVLEGDVEITPSGFGPLYRRICISSHTKLLIESHD